MKPDRLQDSDFETLTNDPVIMTPFFSESKRAAKTYRNKLDALLSSYSVSAELFGSTDLEIDGKGEWEFGIWLDDFALFEDVYEGTKIEVIPMRGDAAARNQAIMKYWRTNPEAVTDYKHGEIEHAYSTREYYRWKNKHISDIVETL
jgi:hypothetical protein